jgi:hypothetical protein
VILYYNQETPQFVSKIAIIELLATKENNTLD